MRFENLDRDFRQFVSSLGTESCRRLPQARKGILANNLAGEVKARGERRRVRSAWMAVERKRGISVSSTVMSFEHQGLAINVLDTRATRTPILAPMPDVCTTRPGRAQ
jgi:hypothetical protein